MMGVLIFSRTRSGVFEGELRDFIEIAASATSFDDLVKRTGRQPASVRNVARRLGIKLAKQIASDNQLAKGLRAKSDADTERS